MSKPKGSFLRFLGYVAPYKKYVIFAAIGGIVKFTVPLYVPQATRHLIDNVYLNATMSVTTKINELLWYILGLIVVFVVFWGPWTYVRHFYASKAGQSSVFDLRRDLYDRILFMSASFFTRHKSGGIVSRLMSDISLAQDLVGNALTNVWMDLAALVVLLYFTLSMDVPLTLVALATFPFYLFFFRRLGRLLKDSSEEVQVEVETMSGKLQEKIAGAIVVRSFSKEAEEGRLFALDSDRLFSKVMRTNLLNAVNITVTGILTSIAPLIVTLYGGWQVIEGKITVGALIAFGMYLGPMYLPMQRFSELNVIYANSMAALDRIFAIMDEKPSVTDREGAHDLVDAEGRVEFRDVSFAYEESRPILSRVSFSANPGEKIAIVGHSGSGKTTIISLVPRFYDVQEGSISVDGHDLRDLSLASLRSHIAMVLQDPILFSGSVRENIQYGNPRASDAQLEAACLHANAWDFIQALPKGLSTEVGERGVLLSGGQKQRLTIARAFLRDPRILILDEATSSLDTESERLIKDALDRLMMNRTTIIIAHRLSTIVNADKILVLHRGRIEEEGRHDELLARHGVYYNLYHRQHRE